MHDRVAFQQHASHSDTMKRKTWCSLLLHLAEFDFSLIATRSCFIVCKPKLQFIREKSFS